MTRPAIGLTLDPAAVFDEAYYLEANPDVAAAGMAASRHFLDFGRLEWRRPAAWFDPRWYSDTVLGNAEGALDAMDAFEHFCRIGNPAGLPASPEEDADALDRARALFDDQHYLASNADIAGSALDPWNHFVEHGWREGRDPSEGFALSWYRDAYMAGQGGGIDLRSVLNPLVHYVRVGRGRGLDTAPPRAVVPSRSDALVRTVAARAQGGQDVPLGPVAWVNGLTDADLLSASPWFDADHYRRETGLAGDRRSLVDHHLATWSTSGVDPSPRFGGRFYARRYAMGPEGMPVTLAPLAFSGDTAPLAHWLRTGRARGLYPNGQAASREAALIRASDRFNASHYRRGRGRDQSLADPVADYVLYGHLAGAEPAAGFDGDLIRDLYGPLTGEVVHAPFAFYLARATAPWMVRSRHDLAQRAAAIRSHPLFDAPTYVAVAGIEGAAADPAEHYVTVGQYLRLRPGPDFDQAFYLATNPDLAEAGVEAMSHYWAHGRAEGRHGHSSGLRDLRDRARVPLDPGRPTAIVVSHEASRTGAPVVALNLARRLGLSHNVVVWLGDDDGPLMAAFAEQAVELWAGWASAREMRAVIEGVRRRTGADLAFVNSVVSHPAVAPLRMAGIAVVSLIHEFADYVLPRGRLSRMALHSDVAVFPAEVVRDACLRELDEMGAIAAPGWFAVRAQGTNAPDVGGADIAADEVAERIGLDRGPGPGRTRVLLGAGQVQPRKGLDIFVQTAQRLVREGRHDWRFIWVGGGYDPERDHTVSTYVEHHIRTAGLTGRVFQFGEQRDLGPFWELADVFLLSSRLDPFPNVALDAWAARVPVVCFQGATGIAEFEPDYPFAVRAVDYADPAAAADAIDDLASRDAVVRAAFEGQEGRALERRVSFDAYVDALLAMGDEARAVVAAADAVGRDLRAVPAEVVRAAIRRVPAIARLAATGEEGRIQTLRSLMVRDVLGTGLRVVGGPARIGGLTDGPTCDARYGSLAAAPADLARHILHLHLDDEAAAAVFDAPDGDSAAPWRAALSTMLACRLVVTVATAPLLRRAEALLDGRGLLIGRIVSGAVGGLAVALDATRPSQGSVASVDDAVVSHLNLGRPEFRIGRDPLRPEHLDLLAGLDSGASLEALASRPEAVAVIPQAPRGSGHMAARRAATALRPGRPIPDARSIPPRMAGTYRRDDLVAFLAAWSDPMRREGAGLGAAAQVTLASYLFALEMGEGRLLRLLEPGD